MAALGRLDSAFASLPSRLVNGRRPVGVARDDVLDAAVTALVAVHADEVATIPAVPEHDSRGLPMEMAYWRPPAV